MAGIGHDLGGGMVAVKDSSHVEVHDLGELLGGVVEQRGALGDASVVDDRVQAAHVCSCLGKGLSYGLERGEVAGTAPDLGLGIGCGQLLNGGVGGLLARAKDGDGSAFLDKTAGDGIADAARASGDDCFLTLEQHGASILRGCGHTQHSIVAAQNEHVRLSVNGTPGCQ